MSIDYVSVATKTLITAGIMQFLRRYLETAVRLPKWDNYLKNAWLGTMVLLLFSSLFSLTIIDKLYYFLFLSGVFYIIYKTRDFRSARLLLIAFTPIVGFGFIDNFFKYIFPNFFSSYQALFETLQGFAICWAIGFGIYAQRQNKREKIERLKEEEARRILEAKKNELEYQVAERTAEITKQKEALENTLEKLKSTQEQLIQSEKLASLGELTAGIAHEIQNPLNFVNNFSELSVGLAQELIEEIEKSSLTPEGGIILKDKAYIEEILGDLMQNQNKINHHGKRASSIVSGMLQHSRSSTGERLLTDINALVDESLRLSYQALRAKDKSFNAKIETNFDQNIPKTQVISQDLGRVFINLINNAFYAISKKHKTDGLGQVIISTKKIDKVIRISIKDNGTGMSEITKAKIFQPFFTTKPTGEGTGLGLSIAYDIITKGHQGTLEVATKEGEFTEFIIKLPL